MEVKRPAKWKRGSWKRYHQYVIINTKCSAGFQLGLQIWNSNEFWWRQPMLVTKWTTIYFCRFRCQFPQNKIHLHWFTHLSRASFGGIANNNGSSVDRSSTYSSSVWHLSSSSASTNHQTLHLLLLFFFWYIVKAQRLFHRDFIFIATLVVRNVKKPTPCWYTSRDWKHRPRVTSCKVLFTRDEFMK